MTPAPYLALTSALVLPGLCLGRGGGPEAGGAAAGREDWPVTTDRRNVYPFRDDGRSRSWSIPYRGEEPADAVQVEHDPDAAEPWTAHYAMGGWQRAALAPADLERMLAGVELRDIRGRRVR